MTWPRYYGNRTSGLRDLKKCNSVETFFEAHKKAESNNKLLEAIVETEKLKTANNTLDKNATGIKIETFSD